MSDHRVGVTVVGVDRFMSGENMDDEVLELVASDERERLAVFLKSLT